MGNQPGEGQRCDFFFVPLLSAVPPASATGPVAWGTAEGGIQPGPPSAPHVDARRALGEKNQAAGQEQQQGSSFPRGNHRDTTVVALWVVNAPCCECVHLAPVRRRPRLSGGSYRGVWKRKDLLSLPHPPVTQSIYCGNVSFGNNLFFFNLFFSFFPFFTILSHQAL